MTNWKRSSYCEGGHCLEVKEAGENLLAIRNSGIWSDQHILARSDEWDAFIAGIKAGEFDPPGLHG